MAAIATLLNVAQVAANVRPKASLAIDVLIWVFIWYILYQSYQKVTASYFVAFYLHRPC
jgi:hypothetical protein